MKRNVRPLVARYNRQRASVMRARIERAYRGTKRDFDRPVFRKAPSKPAKPQRTALPRYVRDGDRIQLVPGNVNAFPGRAARRSGCAGIATGARRHLERKRGRAA